MTPNSEPNALPNILDNWLDWRMTYAEYVEYFNASNKAASDELVLRIRLKRLGYVGTLLETEVTYIKENK